MEGFKIKCTMCGADDVEINESNVYANYKKIGSNIWFYCKECNWEEVFKEIRDEPEEDLETKIIKIVVNNLPRNCMSCTLHEGDYCKLLGNVTGSEYVNLDSDFRDNDCPLETV